MEYLTNDTALTNMANAIRTKTGGSSLITYDETLGFKTAIDAIPGQELEISTSGYPNVETINSNVAVIMNSYAFSYCDKLKTLILPNGKSQNTNATWIGNGCSNIETVLVGAQNAGVPNAFFRECRKLKNMTLGSIGNAVPSIHSTSFYGNTQNGLTITIYVNDDASLPLSGQPWGATNATIIYRSATTGEVLTP